MRPKIKDKELGQAWKFADSSKTVPLVCAVQGYPAPAFRYPFWNPLSPFEFSKEPQTSIPPKMKDKELGQVKKQIESNRTLPLICAVQGYPAPVFRYKLSPRQFQSPPQA